MTELSKPTYLRAAVEDWVKGLISVERLFEIWRVQYHGGYNAIRNEQDTTREGFDIPTERIEEILEGLK